MNIRQFTKKHHFPDDHRFSYKNGFNIAVAFTGFDDVQEWDLDPNIGDLQFRASEWGNNPDGSVYWDQKVLKSHKCTREELGLAPDRKGARFMPAVQRHHYYIDYHHNHHDYHRNHHDYHHNHHDYHCNHNDYHHLLL